MTSHIRTDDRPVPVREPVAKLSAEERQLIENMQKQRRAEHRKPGWRRLSSDSTLFFIPIF